MPGAHFERKDHRVGAPPTAQCRTCGTPMFYVPLIGYVSEYGWVCRDEAAANFYADMETEGMHLV